MLSVFLFCCGVTCHFKIREMSNKEMSHLIAKDKSVWLVFAVNRSDDKVWGMARDVAYANKKSDHIVFYDRLSAMNAENFSGVSGPSLYFFNSSVFVAAFKLPTKKKALGRLVQRLLSNADTVIDTKEEFKKQLKEANYSVLATPEQLHHGKFVWYEFGKRISDVQLLCVSDDLFDGIPGIDSSQLALYRLVDKQYESFDRNSMFSVLKPRVREFSVTDIEKEAETMVTITADKLTDEQRKAFRHLSNEFNFQFGTIQEGLLKIVSLGFGQEFDVSKPVHIFNYKNRYFYPSADIPSGDYEALKKAMMEIEQGSRQRKYISESLDNARSGVVETIVGLNYMKFVQQSVDTLVLFSSDNCKPCQESMKILEEFQSKCNKAKVEVKSAVINIDKNSEQYPWIPNTPYIVLFPMRNKSDFQPLRGRTTVNSLTVLLEHYGSTTNLPFHGEPPTRAEFQADLARISPTVEQMPEDDRRKYYQWMFVMSKEVEKAHAASAERDEL